MVSETTVRVLARLGKGPLADERTYLLKVVYTVGASVLGRRRRETPTDTSADGDLFVGDGSWVSRGRSAEDAALSGLDWAELQSMLATQLRPDEGRAVLARSLNWPPQDIAAAMGWSERRYRKLLEHGHRKMRTEVLRRRDEDLLVLYAMGALTGEDRRRAELLAATAGGERFVAARRAGSHATFVGWRDSARAVATDTGEGA